MFLLPLIAVATVQEKSAADLRSYRYPSWFRDAKFGIWAHWGPQSVPGQGDWFARKLYIQGDPDYTYHLQYYGHPSKSGYKDLIPLWKAEKWDPDRLMKLYKKAGARYFVSMGVHHDNFDLWNSHYHRWNAVNMGPHRDVVGTWQTAAKRQGLKFGVSEHLGASFNWFQVSHGSDKTGPFAGAPYDGQDPKLWDLYHQPSKPGDTGWYSTDPTWQAEWKQRVYDLIDSYHPDLLYSDGGVPFANSVGYGMIDHFYKSGKDVIYTCKQPSNGAWVEDFERGVMRGVSPYPFQTDTSIGDWFYNVNWKFRDIKWVVHTLLDDVSKNGNLLLNVVQRPDGSLDPEVETLLQQMADWISINGEGIYGSRPWITFGEGKVQAKGGSFREDFAYTGEDVRFTTKKGALYAYCLGWPGSGNVLIRSLAAAPGSGRIEDVRLLGLTGPLTWSQDQAGLHIALPTRPLSEVAICFKITGKDLMKFAAADPQSAPAPQVAADASGDFTLAVNQAELHGSGLQTEHNGDRDDIGYWDSPSDWVSWKLHVSEAGSYRLVMAAASPTGQPTLAVLVGNQKRLDWKVPHTSSFSEYTESQAGTISLSAGDFTLSAKPVERGWSPINLAALRLVRVK